MSEECYLLGFADDFLCPYLTFEPPDIYLGAVLVLFKISLGIHCGIVQNSLAQPRERSARVWQLERVAGLQRAIVALGSKELLWRWAPKS